MLWAFRLLFGFEEVNLRAPRAAAHHGRAQTPEQNLATRSPA